MRAQDQLRQALFFGTLGLIALGLIEFGLTTGGVVGMVEIAAGVGTGLLTMRLVFELGRDVSELSIEQLESTR